MTGGPSICAGPGGNSVVVRAAVRFALMATIAVPGLVVGSPGLVVVAPMGGIWWAHWRRRRARTTRRNAHERAQVAAVDALIQHLKGGGSLRSALGRIGSPTPMRPPVQTPTPGAVVGARLIERTAPGDLVATTLAVLVERGGAALPSLERLSDTLRSAQAIDAEARAGAGQASASALVMAALPAVFVVVLASIDDRLRAFYLFHPAGTLCLVAAIALSHLSWWLMNHLIESV